LPILARLHEKYGLPVYPIALFSYDKPARPEPREYRVAFPDLEVLIFRFRTVQLNQLDWHAFARHANPVAAAFLARMRGARAEKAQVLRHALEPGFSPSDTRPGVSPGAFCECLHAIDPAGGKRVP